MNVINEFQELLNKKNCIGASKNKANNKLPDDNKRRD